METAIVAVGAARSAMGVFLGEGLRWAKNQVATTVGDGDDDVKSSGDESVSRKSILYYLRFMMQVLLESMNYDVQ
ncbi:hypothetical protein L2E82_40104 [Cichorium intybus]|uniref:Uncharacterized protein n=1 Tax=Cichorium intybus TaxID=13427 RepID=A0ACB9AKR0_CICIN|nr:hypothetical protein L2E82_40104 [Cichorium intybus]